ncbi:MAG: MEDS domain-containing protein [Acidobacteria bacterium]|nr:MEDS domain-containing protein [Acidobacteriota bacterium]
MDITGELFHAKDQAEGSTAKTSAGSIPFAGSELGEWRHVCAFFNSDDEEYNVLLPFIRDGFACGDKAVHIVNQSQRENHLQRLSEAGIEFGQAQRCGQIEVRSNTETYLLDGQFDQDRMLGVFEQMVSGRESEKFPRSRIVCQMDWAAASERHVEELIEFESRVNDLWQRHPDVVICTYRLGKFSGDTVIDIMRTHPMIIIGGILQHNPFYVPSEEFLHEIRERRSLRN